MSRELIKYSNRFFNPGKLSFELEAALNAKHKALWNISKNKKRC